MRYVLVKDGIVENAIELAEDNFTTSFIENDRGDKLPTEIINGVTVVSTTKYLVPQGYSLYPSDAATVGDNWLGS